MFKCARSANSLFFQKSLEIKIQDCAFFPKYSDTPSLHQVRNKNKNVQKTITSNYCVNELLVSGFINPLRIKKFKATNPLLGLKSLVPIAARIFF